MPKVERTIGVRDRDELVGLLGAGDRHLRAVRDAFRVQVTARDGEVKISGSAAGVEKAERVFERMLESVRDDGWIDPERVREMIDEEGESEGGNAAPGTPGFVERRKQGPIEMSRRGSQFNARTPGQQTYIDAIRQNDICFCIGPAGTGKTYIAVALAVEALKAGAVRRILLARPAVEAGERLGFLPGDVAAKVNPYLRPLYDSLNAILDTGQLKKLLDAEVVEICPLAYMRGRTLDDAFIILDEAQNTTTEQMKMFLTRMGNGSRVVVTGDITQIDLPPGKLSGLVESQGFLRDIPGLTFIYLSRADIVRNPIVQRIVAAYERMEEGKRRKKQARRP